MPEKSDDERKRCVVGAAILGTVAGILISKRLEQAVFLEQVVLGMRGKRLMLYKI